MVARVSILVVVCVALVAGVSAGRLVRTPFGKHWEECVHEVPDGAEVRNEADHLVVSHPSFDTPRVIPRCGLTWPASSGGPMTADGFDDDDDANGDGWQAYTKQKIKGTISSFTGVWPVPILPKQEAQTLFTFPGLQNIDWVPPNPQPSQPFDIIQPVLQYGSSSAGAFDAWSIASWYVTLTTDVVFSTLKKVSPGDVLFGNMTRTGTDSWFINTVDRTSGIQSSMTITRSILSAQPWAYVALEVYDVEDCEQFPAKSTTTPYTDLELVVEGKPQSFDWAIGKSGQHPPTCDASIEIVSPAAVTIKW